MENAAMDLTEIHNQWLDEIRTLESEIDRLVEINSEVIQNTEDKESAKKVEHFENQFAIQKSRLDEMKHNIKIYGGDLSRGRQELDEYKNYYGGLKDEFHAFAAPFM